MGSAGCRPRAERERTWASAVPHQLGVPLGCPSARSARWRWTRRRGSSATWASVLPEQYQSRSCPPGPQPRRSYSAIETSVYVVPSVCSTSRNVPPDRQLPAHVRLGLDGCTSLLERQPVQGAAAPPWKSVRLWKMHASWPSTSTVSVLRSPSSSVSTQSSRRTLPGRLELPEVRRRAASTHPATRFSSSLSAKCAPSVQQPVSGDVL